MDWILMVLKTIGTQGIICPHPRAIYMYIRVRIRVRVTKTRPYNIQRGFSAEKY